MLSFLVAASGQAQTLISDFSADESIATYGGSWIWDSSTKDLDIGFRNSTNDYLEGVLSTPISISGAIGLTLTARAEFFPPEAPTSLRPGNFQLYITSSSALRATADFTFLDFVSATNVSVFKPFTSVDPGFDYKKMTNGISSETAT